MDGMRKIARAYYAQASKDEKNSIQKFFKNIDANGDGKVSLVEFKKSSVSSWLSNDESIYRQLDTNDDGTLDFDEVLALYYMEKKVSIHKCDACLELLVGLYFSCWLCFGKPNIGSTDLCCSCYHRGTFKHEHALSNFLDNHSLVTKFRIQTRDAQRAEEKKEMDKIGKMARAYYAQAGEVEKNSIQELFNEIDSDGDGKVSLVEFNKFAGSESSDAESIFRYADANGDGTLDFDEVLTLYYLHSVSIHTCDSCDDFLVGPYFSCWLCFGKGNNSIDLCCTCYDRGSFKHEHALSNFLDTHSLVDKFRIQTSDAQSAEEKKEMDELRMIAKAHYGAGSPEVQALAHEFFNSMDTDGDGRVDLQEFLTFIREEGYTQMRNPYFFKELDKDGNGTLDFFEVLTVYYIIISGRPFCDCCGKFVPGIFFSCVECFKSPQSSFTLCSKCYQSTECKHNHNGRVQFLDNYTLLETKRDPAPARATVASQNTRDPAPARATDASQNKPRTRPTDQVVRASKLNKWRLAKDALDIAIGIGNISGMCTIL